MSIELSTDPSLMSLADIAAIYASVGFGSEADYIGRPHFMERLFGPGVFGVFAFDGGKPVGFLRALSDGCMVAWIAEVCVIPSHQRRGIGNLLLADLIAESEKRGFRQMIAVIGDSANTGSVAVHARAGFEMTGTFKSVGFKFGRWLDTVMMQKALGPGDTTPPAS